jgi:hypothetical protein
MEGVEGVESRGRGQSRVQYHLLFILLILSLITSLTIIIISHAH